VFQSFLLGGMAAIAAGEKETQLEEMFGTYDQGGLQHWLNLMRYSDKFKFIVQR
jgi:hypothetical protein